MSCRVSCHSLSSHLTPTVSSRLLSDDFPHFDTDQRRSKMRINKKGAGPSGTGAMTVADGYDQSGMMVPSSSYLDADELADAMDLGIPDDMDPDMDFLDMIHPMYTNGGPSGSTMYPMYVSSNDGAVGFTAQYPDDMMMIQAGYPDDYYLQSPGSVASHVTVSNMPNNTTRGSTVTSTNVASAEATSSGDDSRKTASSGTTVDVSTSPAFDTHVVSKPATTVTPTSDLLKRLMTQSAIPSIDSTVLSTINDADRKSSSGAKPKQSSKQRERVDWSSDDGSVSQGDNPRYAGTESKTDMSEFDKFANPPPKQRKNVDVDSVVERNRKNAIQARMNRQRKKQMVQSLESQVDELADENKTLKTENASLREERDGMADEIVYLKNVLANESMLSKVLKNIGQVSEVRLSKAFSSKKRKSANDADSKLEHSKNHCSASDCQKCKNTIAQMGSGVCLHIENNDVSLEFCSKCAKMAKSGTL